MPAPIEYSVNLGNIAFGLRSAIKENDMQDYGNIDNK